ncbi:MAG: hypothetical protein WDN31_02610 [Hyphomicrobium sp.]
MKDRRISEAQWRVALSKLDRHGDFPYSPASRQAWYTLFLFGMGSQNATKYLGSENGNTAPSKRITRRIIENIFHTLDALKLPTLTLFPDNPMQYAAWVEDTFKPRKQEVADPERHKALTSSAECAAILGKLTRFGVATIYGSGIDERRHLATDLALNGFERRPERVTLTQREYVARSDDAPLSERDLIFLCSNILAALSHASQDIDPADLTASVVIIAAFIKNGRERSGSGRPVSHRLPRAHVL